MLLPPGRDDRPPLLALRQADLPALRRADAGRAALPRLRRRARAADLPHGVDDAAEGRRRSGSPWRSSSAVLWGFCSDLAVLPVPGCSGSASPRRWPGRATTNAVAICRWSRSAVVVGLWSSARVLLAQRFGVTWEQINALDPPVSSRRSTLRAHPGRRLSPRSPSPSLDPVPVPADLPLAASLIPRIRTGGGGERRVDWRSPTPGSAERRVSRRGSRRRRC